MFLFNTLIISIIRLPLNISIGKTEQLIPIDISVILC
uniref:Uncharacterized protein n=1 Tax=Cyanidium caldarium TaxID=2771 RepID=Q9TM04_CYACA|nr:hypothetical protein JXY51_pgp108 [Cyanidium caldarium]AAF12981.1 unknown [Cyanidium caldarium]